MEKGAGIHVTEEAVQLVLWFDKTCLAFVHDTDDESELQRTSNVLVDKVKATLTVDGIPEELATYMASRKNNRAPYDHELKAHTDYESIGRKLYVTVLKRVNRLISYARVVKGQFWLLEHELDPNRAHSFWTCCNAKGTFDQSEYFWFLPGRGDQFTMTGQY